MDEISAERLREFIERKAESNKDYGDEMIGFLEEEAIKEKAEPYCRAYYKKRKNAKRPCYIVTFKGNIIGII